MTEWLPGIPSTDGEGRPVRQQTVDGVTVREVLDTDGWRRSHYSDWLCEGGEEK